MTATDSDPMITEEPTLETPTDTSMPRVDTHKPGRSSRARLEEREQSHSNPHTSLEDHTLSDIKATELSFMPVALPSGREMLPSGPTKVSLELVSHSDQRTMDNISSSTIPSEVQRPVSGSESMLTTQLSRSKLPGSQSRPDAQNDEIILTSKLRKH